MNRRKLLISTAAGALVLVGVRLGFGGPESAIVRVLHKRLDYLKLDEEGVRRFAADVAKRNVVSPFRLTAIDFVGPLYTDTNVSPDGHFGSALRHGEDRVITQFLISSDFFINGADTTRVVKYLGWFNPLAACSNPFARPPIGAST